MNWLKIIDRPLVASVHLSFALAILVAPATIRAMAQDVANKTDGVSGSGINRVAELQVVDCLLPGQVRSLGNRTYLSQRRPIQTTAADCKVRGGEYVAYDRANYKTALTVWLPAAESGDLEAQVNVGEIFERGLGGEPNYAAAEIWYRKAAEQGNARAQFNLGTLYEQGQGVEKDQLQALNWYRKAWGLAEDDVIFQSAANQAQQALRAELEAQLDQKDSQIGILSRQIQQLQSTLEQQSTPQEKSSETIKLEKELQQLQAWVSNLEKERAEARRQMTSMPVFREPKIVSTPIERQSSANTRSGSSVNFGKYYALVIGNRFYSNMENLSSPVNDADVVSEILESKYGFAVKKLINVNDEQIMTALNDLYNEIGEDDNLLIYYAGHGTRVQAMNIENGYWLPVNADPPPRDTHWVANESITRHLGRIKAKRILVVSDSCYAGLLSSAPGYLFVGDKPEYPEAYLLHKLAKRSRLLLSSGGDKPVLDNAGEGHSVFARAFIEALRQNQQIIAGPELFLKVRANVVEKAETFGISQEPEFKAIKGAGHEVGDFFFVPVSG